MLVNLTAPSSLLLGLARLRSNQLAWLAITLQHPPLTLAARPAAALLVTGARADLARAQAERVRRALGLLPAEIEIEYAIPRYLGLGSEPMLGLAVARALAALARDPDAEDPFALAEALGLAGSDGPAVHGFSRGGLLLVPAEPGLSRWPPPLRRFELAHPDDTSWAWVLHWPFPPEGTAPALEADRAAHLLAAAPHLSAETGRLVEDELWPALEGDDLGAFGRALMAFQQLNRAALEQAGLPVVSSPEAAGVLGVLRDNGALAWGESAAGLARFGIIRGGSPSVALRRKVVDYVGYEGGTVMAAIADNQGATCLVGEEPERT